MANAARAKGTSWETALCKYFNEHNLATHRLPLSSGKGDLNVFGVDVAIEAKSHRALDLGSWSRQAEQSARAKGVIPYAVLHKRVGRSAAADGYCTIPVWYFVQLLKGQKWS